MAGAWTPIDLTNRPARLWCKTHAGHLRCLFTGRELHPAELDLFHPVDVTDLAYTLRQTVPACTVEHGPGTAADLLDVVDALDNLMEPDNITARAEHYGDEL